MQRLEVSGAVRPIYGSLGVKRLRILLHKAEMKKKLTILVLNFFGITISCSLIGRFGTLTNNFLNRIVFFPLFYEVLQQLVCSNVY